jgi:HSP20 family protein
MFRDLMTLQDRMNRLFEGSLPRTSREDDRLFAGTWAPAVDIYEDEQSIVLKADVPDIDPKDVDIRIEDNVLFLRGERKFDKEVKEDNFHRIERAYGSFARSFALPHTVASDQINAEYKNGVLKITMPKREESKPKQIKVTVQ